MSIPESQKKARLEELLYYVWGERQPRNSLLGMRYQLLHALAGTAIQTLHDARRVEESAYGTGVLIVHVFETYGTKRTKLRRNQKDLEEFIRILPNIAVPTTGIVLGCLYGPARILVSADFVPLGCSAIVDVYLGKLETNLKRQKEH